MGKISDLLRVSRLNVYKKAKTMIASSVYPVSSKILKDMAMFEDDLASLLMKAPRVIAEPVSKTLKAGGKRLRPALLLLSGMAGKYDYSRLRSAALAVEIIHMASLIHDDVLDRAAVRRGYPTIYKEHGATAALSSGDHLFALSFKELCRIGEPRVLALMADVAQCLSIGELDEIVSDKDAGMEAYIKRVFNKTAYLFSASCELGALIANAGEDDVQACAVYGRSLGIAFQIYDDVLDITGTDDALGKTAGTDIRQGVLSLPAILALSDPLVSGQYRALQEKLAINDKNGNKKLQPGGREHDRSMDIDDEIQDLIHQMKKAGIADKASSIARDHLVEGDLAVERLDNKTLVKNFKGISKFVIERYN